MISSRHEVAVPIAADHAFDFLRGAELHRRAAARLGNPTLTVPASGLLTPRSVMTRRERWFGATWWMLWRLDQVEAPRRLLFGMLKGPFNAASVDITIEPAGEAHCRVTFIGHFLPPGGPLGRVLRLFCARGVRRHLQSLGDQLSTAATNPESWPEYLPAPKKRGLGTAT